MKNLIIILIFSMAFIACDRKPENAEELISKSLNQTGGIHQWKSVKSWTQKHNFVTLFRDKKVVDKDETIQTELPYNRKQTSYSGGKIATIDLTNSETNRKLYQYSNGKPNATMNIAVQKPYANDDLKILENTTNWTFYEDVWDNKPSYFIKNDSLKVKHIYDKETYLKIASIEQTSYGEAIISYKNYQHVNGFLIPFLKENEIKSSKYKQITSIKEVTFYEEFDAATFIMDDSWSKIVIGNQLPSLPASIKGNELQIMKNSLDNKLVLIDFWATWCKPCIKEFPNLRSLYKEYKDDGFEILAIALDKETSTNNYLSKNNISWPNVTFEKAFKSDIAQLLEVASIPRAILVDSNGKIIALDESAKGEPLRNTLKKFFKKS